MMQTSSVWNDLGLSGTSDDPNDPRTPLSEIERQKRKKLMAAGTTADPMARYGSAAMALLGSRSAPP